MRRRKSSIPSTCLYGAGALTPSRAATAARLTEPMPVSSASSAAEATTSAVFRPALGISALGEERQEGVCDLLRVLRVGVVARVLDHHRTGPDRQAAGQRSRRPRPRAPASPDLCCP